MRPRRQLFKRTSVFLSLALPLLLFQTGCAVLLGNVKPVDQKSESYGVLDLAKNSPDWIALPPSSQTGQNGDNPDPNLTPTEVSDVAYQSRSTHSVISLNSACRSKAQGSETDLKKLTDLLFLGMQEVTMREEMALQLQNAPALQTTLRGNLNGEDVMLRTVVLKKGNCIYDLVFLSRPDHFGNKLTDFSQFVDSLRLKD